jgi:threonine synthase
VAGLLRIAADGLLAPGSTVVCVLTGHGLKDPQWAMQLAGRPPTVPADPEAVAAKLGL